VLELRYGLGGEHPHARVDGLASVVPADAVARRRRDCRRRDSNPRHADYDSEESTSRPVFSGVWGALGCP
jgi:hypothetical protein